MLPNLRSISIRTLLLFSACSLSHAQDPVAVDPQHNKIEYEDAKIRVVRYTLAPGEKSAMHEHPEMLVVNLSNARIRITDSTGNVQDIDFHAGEVLHRGPVRHAAENIGNTVWEEVFTEFKRAGVDLAKVESVSPVQPAPNSPPSPAASVVTPTQPSANPAPAVPRAPAVSETPAPTQPVPQPVTPSSDAIPANPNGTKMQFVNGTELAFVDRGQGQPLVFVHDTLGDYRSWTRQFAALSANYHVIAYSRRYHYPNHATGKEGDYTYEQNAKDLADFIRSLNLGPVRLVGHGYGASIAAMTAAEHPELVKTLAISEPGFDAMLDSSRAYNTRFAREEIYGIIRKPLTKGDPVKGVQMYVDWLRAERWDTMPVDEQFRRKQNAYALRDQSFFAAPPAFACPEAKKITAPTLLISGQNRSPNSAEISGILSACVPNAERVSVPNSANAPYLDNPYGYTKAVAAFQAKH
ncbi:MAG: hypothetical protein JWO13_3471 [Acidobacteriales bacterium]|nr:hypothetical protein [Terriglobales bacterium]